MKYWDFLAENFNRRALRERLIIGLVVLAIVYMVVDFSLLSSLQVRKNALQQRAELAQQEMNKFSAQEKVLAQALTNDPNAAKKRDIARMEQRLKEIDKNLETLSSGLIAAEKLPTVLYDVLDARGSLSLLGMETIEPTRLQLETEAPVLAQEMSDFTEDDELEHDANEKNIGVFKHSVLVSLEGKYFDVVGYLQALEKLPWKFYWEAIDYQVEDYPKARILIEVYTLSTEAGILGV